jgi:hypothetical protein
MKSVRRKVTDTMNSIKEGEQKGAQEAMMEEIFHDMYRERKRIYQVNFVRGIFFGAGSAIGGTLVLGVFLWILSLFVNFPVVGNFFRDAQNTIQQSQQSPH